MLFIFSFKSKNMEISVGHTPDSDDAFMFYGMLSGKIRSNDFTIKHVIGDIEELNQKAVNPELDVTAVSVHACAYLPEYTILRSGGSFGIGCVVSHNPEKNKSLSVLSLSLGNRHSGLTMDGEFQTFGDIDINGERQTFTIHNYFIDLNLKSVGIFSRKKFSEKTLFFIQSAQLGILTGLNKSHWKIEETQERIQGVNKTFPLSFYIKISLGLGAN